MDEILILCVLDARLSCGIILFWYFVHVALIVDLFIMKLE